MLDSLAHGLRECASKPIIGPRLQLDNFLDNMLRSRISRRVLAEQHIHLENSNAKAIGIISTELSLYEAVHYAAQRTRQVCNETYGRSPDIIVSGDVRAVMPYIPMHIDYMLYELMKNSSRSHPALCLTMSPPRAMHSHILLSKSPRRKCTIRDSKKKHRAMWHKKDSM
eukprot:scaffold57375_cov31-Prasinocladus_malaysianus.AAC.1